jgi:hypothetical protein
MAVILLDQSCFTGGHELACVAGLKDRRDIPNSIRYPKLPPSGKTLGSDGRVESAVPQMRPRISVLANLH